MSDIEARYKKLLAEGGDPEELKKLLAAMNSEQGMMQQIQQGLDKHDVTVRDKSTNDVLSLLRPDADELTDIPPERMKDPLDMPEELADSIAESRRVADLPAGVSGLSKDERQNRYVGSNYVEAPYKEKAKARAFEELKNSYGRKKKKTVLDDEDDLEFSLASEPAQVTGKP